jgi:hypothetical protein
MEHGNRQELMETSSYHDESSRRCNGFLSHVPYAT